ncbi:ribosomal L1 domain-containing protein [Musa troglodytarum]|uniref:Ribosomal L1 domain-containing protein n=1 Tax=Musa troglodytarum TaxID=320322 RepID=A0A9E7KK96_9LILI|nr:ribosomal L1 domain-containing protein [Musa troglodytarum]
MPSQQRRTPASKVGRDAVARAVDALLKWLLRSSNTKRRLHDEADDDFVYLVLTLKKIPHRGRPFAFRVPLPSSPHSSACLLVDDRPKSALSSAAARAQVRDLALPVSNVLGLSELRSLCRSPEARHSLAGSHDLFLADSRLAPLFPALLGNLFFSKKKNKSKNKTPVPLDLALRSWPEELRRVCGSTLFHLGPGTCSVVKVGRASLGRDEVIDNVLAAIEGVVGHVPNKWKNVKYLHLKATESLALPLYRATQFRIRTEGSNDEEEEERGDKDEHEQDEGALDVIGDEQNRMKRTKNKSEKTKTNDATAIKRRKVKHGIERSN